MQARTFKVLICSLLSCLAVASESDAPHDSGVVEKAGVRLAQLDVTVSGPEKKLAELGPDDFELTIAGRAIEELSIDRVCPVEAPVEPLPSNYMLYFDHALLGMAGRDNALRLARDLIPELLARGATLMIVSNGRSLTTLAELTADSETLLDALDRMQSDPSQWRFGSNAEHWNGDRSLRRLSIALARLAGLAPPKGVIFFAGQLGQDSAYPLVVEEAGAQGVRIYPVQTYTLVAETRFPKTRSVLDGTIELDRVPPALETLAAETGGRAFSAAIGGKLLADRVHEDATCFFLLSYDPVGLRLDVPLSVNLEMRPARVKAHVRRTTLIQSQSARTKSRLLSAFTMPATGRTDLGLRGDLVPTGWQEGKYTALVQIKVQGSTLANAVWDLGASLLSRGGVVQTASGRVETDLSGVAIVLESEMSFGAAPWELIAVAHETNREMSSFSVIATDTRQGLWPDPGEAVVGVRPISVLQPEQAVFVRDGRTRTTGAVARGPNDPVWTDRPTVLLGLVCRGAEVPSPVRVESNLVGESPVAFPAKEIEFGDERCVQVRDLIPAGSMSAGGFTYELHVRGGEGDAASVTREFFAVEPDATEGPQG